MMRYEIVLISLGLRHSELRKKPKVQKYTYSVAGLGPFFKSEMENNMF